jgi:hypothetical protein
LPETFRVISGRHPFLPKILLGVAKKVWEIEIFCRGLPAFADWGDTRRRSARLRLFFLAEFLECGIGAQRVPERIEARKGGRNGRLLLAVKPADMRRL